MNRTRELGPVNALQEENIGHGETDNNTKRINETATESSSECESIFSGGLWKTAPLFELQPTCTSEFDKERTPPFSCGPGVGGWRRHETRPVEMTGVGAQREGGSPSYEEGTPKDRIPVGDGGAVSSAPHRQDRRD
ncbi:hypothetical protein EYF80_027243 [Liparis tanakae]|uniref:Uncharacterized protein n=1 Tax=Liparis tanakae TaxID=230148 RepID=A0A4Z2HAJ5_9TELE|nr:hypothetical protein EYF80_027243 [Liparis tanakae]